MPITDYKILLPIVMVVNAIGGVVAITLSMGIIPKEYERKTSQLIWIRGVRNWYYHGALTCANMIGSVLAIGIMYCFVVVFIITKGEGISVGQIGDAFVLLALNEMMVS